MVVDINWLIEVGKQYGPLAVVVAYVIWDKHMTIQRYITIIEKLSDSFQSLKKDIEIIKERIWKP